jgi:hypothetical protein
MAVLKKIAVKKTAQHSLGRRTSRTAAFLADGIPGVYEPIPVVLV